MSRDNYAVVAASYFDGERSFPDGPYTLVVENGSIVDIASGDLSEALERRGVDIRKAVFLMPGFVEAHSHLFLDGGLLDFKERNNYLKASHAEMLRVAKDNLLLCRAAGVTLVRDLGDRYGVNHSVRAEEHGVAIRSVGSGLRKRGRYGGFMAREVSSLQEITVAVNEISQSADDLKVILTGIIDFQAGAVKGSPQFAAEELCFITDLARQRGLRTVVHCSGVEGLERAVAAGVDSIEHGFFMTRSVLEGMADRNIAWTPTISPVYFQWLRPELAGWDQQTVANLRRILDRHLEHIALAAALGVPLVAGSDAGSHGVVHGAALIDELDFLLEAGLPMETVLSAATSVPRLRWGVEPHNLSAGRRAEFIALSGSPLVDPCHLHAVEAVYCSNNCSQPLTAIGA